MDYRPLGRSGIKVSKFGLGTMVLGAWGNSDVDACSRIINKALDAGINLLDTADVYGEGQNERIVGLAIANRRDEIVLCTKFHHAVEALAMIADKASLSLTHMSLAWATEHPALSATLIGPRTESQLDDLLQASDFLLTPDILDMIDAVVPPGTTINPADLGWNPPGLTTNARRRRHS